MFFKKKNVRVSIRNKKLVVETKTGINLYKFLLSESVIPQTLCDGSGLCGKCKIRFIGQNIPKPTNKEILILAKVNIELGYRLACQHNIKADIEVDTSEISSSVLYAETNPTYPKAIPERKVEKHKLPEKEKEEQTTQKEHETPAPEEAENTAQEQTDNDQISINEFKPVQTKPRPQESHEIDGSSDGIFLIQQRGGVRYFCYSAALDNIVSEGTSNTNETLVDVIDNRLVSDFIHDVLKIKDIDRVLILIESQNSYETENILDMARYFKFEIGQLLCEVMMPHNENHDIIRLFRLITASRSNRLIIFLDMMDRVYFYTNKLLADMRFDSLPQNNMIAVKERGVNPITAFDQNFGVKSVEKHGHAPDGITLPALLEAVKLLHQKGMIDSSFRLKTRTELAMQKLPLDLSVRMIGKTSSEGFYLYRDRFSDIILSQTELDTLFQIKAYITAMVKYTSERIEKIEGISFYTNANHDNLINLMIDLQFVPKEYADKITYYPGESTVHAIKLFKEKDLPSYIKRNMDNVKKIEVESDQLFIDIADNCSLKR